jgi:integrase
MSEASPTNESRRLDTRSKGGRPAKDHLHQNRRTGEYRVRWIVREELIPIIGKGTLIRPLGTKDYQEARRRSYGPNAECQSTIEDAERQLRGEPKPRYNWPAYAGYPARFLTGTPPPDHVVAAGERYQAFLQREQEIDTGRLRGEPERTADFETIITDRIREKKPREGSVRMYRSVMRQFQKWLGHSKASRVTKERLNDYKRHLLDKSANTTVKNHILVFRGLFGFASDNGIITGNPAATITLPETESNRRAFTSDERKLVLIEARKAEPLIKWATWISAFSGARLSEITKADKSDIELEGDYVILSVPKDRAKNGKPRRVPLHSSVLREGFREYLATLPDQGPLFPDRVGWNHSSIVNPWMRAEPIKITDKNVKFHSHRHTFYSIANELIDGENPRIPERFAEKIAGHSDGRASRKYGDVPIATLAAYVERIPDPTLE